LRGDANTAIDLDAPTVKEAERVVWSVERLGYVVTWLTSAGGIVATGGFLTGVLVPGFWPAPTRRRGRRTDHRPGLIAVGVTMVSIILAGTMVGIGSVPATQASWTDRADASTGQFVAHTVARPTEAPKCSNEGGLLG